MSYSGQYEHLVGPLVPARIGTIRPNPPRHTDLVGLLDTGATVSVISSHVAEYLELRSASHASLRGVHGTELAPIHIVKMTFRSGKRQREFIRGVFETRQRWNDEYSMLIGRDILQYGSLRMKGTWFSFSMSPLDSV